MRRERSYIYDHDIDEALEYCDLAETMDATPRTPLRRAVLSALIVAYARPFSGNNEPPKGEPPKSKRHRLESEGIENFDRYVHEAMLKLRNGVVGHSDYQQHAQAIRWHKNELLGNIEVPISRNTDVQITIPDLGAIRANLQAIRRYLIAWRLDQETLSE